MRMPRLFLLMPAMTISFAIAACGNLAYVPDQATVKNIPLDVAVLDASDAASQAAVLYDKGHFVGDDTTAIVKLTGFRVSADGKRATADYSINGEEQSCTEPSDWWLGSGPHTGGIYIAGTIPFPDSKAIGGTYCMTQNLIFSDCDFRFICWSDRAPAMRFVNSMSAVVASAGPGFAQALVSSELLPDNYPSSATDKSSPFSVPDTISAVASHARAAAYAGQVDVAIAQYKQSLELARVWPAGHYNLAVLYAREDKYSDAVNEMNTYLALLPNAPNAPMAEKLVVQWQSENTGYQ